MATATARTMAITTMITISTPDESFLPAGYAARVGWCGRLGAVISA